MAYAAMALRLQKARISRSKPDIPQTRRMGQELQKAEICSWKTRRLERDLLPITMETFLPSQ